MTHARHAKPASNRRRILTGAAETLAVLLVFAAVAAGLATAANASTASRHPHPNHAVTRLCDALRAANDAGLPSDRQIRTIARDGLSASQPWRDAAGQLIMAIYAGGPFGAQYTHLAEICNPGWAS